MSPASPSTAQSSVLPRRFGRYLLFDRIGKGGMAEIYLARASTELGGARLSVVKQMLPELSEDTGFAKMLIAEAKLAARLNHVNVVQVFDLGREGGRLFIAMEYVEGFDLNDLLRRLSKARIPLPAEFALLIVRDALAGLDYAHRARDDEGRPLGLVHRDVSPSNVLVSFEGEVKLCDFGIARAASGGGDEQLVQRTRVAGKSAYMAPEHARGETVDARADVFAAGILLWELCAGRRLFKGTDEEMLAQARAGVVPPLPDRGLPSADKLQALLDRALATDRNARFQTAAEMLRALDDYALSAKLMASPLRFGAFLTEHFEADIVQVRRARERAAQALEQSAPQVATPLATESSEIRARPEQEAPVSERDTYPPASLRAGGGPISGGPISATPYGATPIGGGPISAAPYGATPISGAPQGPPSFVTRMAEGDATAKLPLPPRVPSDAVPVVRSVAPPPGSEPAGVPVWVYVVLGVALMVAAFVGVSLLLK